MANKEKMGPPTLEMIQGNPYNYTFDEVAKLFLSSKIVTISPKKIKPYVSAKG